MQTLHAESGQGPAIRFARARELQPLNRLQALEQPAVVSTLQRWSAIEPMALRLVQAAP